MHRYKLRAETDRDVFEFIRIAPEAKDFNFEYLSDSTLDCIVTFDSKLSLTDILNRLDQIEDSHVMKETVDLEEYYTGIR